MSAAPLEVQQVAIRVHGVQYTIPRPNRHADLIKALIKNGMQPPIPGGEAQGFMLTDGSFATRKQATFVAEKNGQLKHDLLGSVLTSEDLW